MHEFRLILVVSGEVSGKTPLRQLLDESFQFSVQCQQNALKLMFADDTEKEIYEKVIRRKDKRNK